MNPDVTMSRISRHPKAPQMWLQKYGLTKDDYNVLQKDGEWLSDMHMSAVS